MEGSKSSQDHHMRYFTKGQRAKADLVLAPILKEGEATGSWSLRCHSLILCRSNQLAQSCRLAKMERSPGNTYKRVLRMDVDEEAAKALLDFFYIGLPKDFSHLSDRIVAQLADVAEKLNIPGETSHILNGQLQ